MRRPDMTMTNRIILALVLGTAGYLSAQTKVDLSTQTRNVDFSAAQSTRPVKVGNALPATCRVGEMFFADDAEAGRNLYGCVAPNQWGVMSASSIASGCGLMGCESGTCAIDSAVIPSYAGPLTPHGVVVARDSSTIAAVAAGTAGSILMSNGPGADPVWAPASTWTNHAGLGNLDYENSGHTGFQPALGYTPERQLTFEGALVRTGDTVACPTCQGASYAQSFTAATAVTLAHGLASADLLVHCYDGDGARVEPDRVRVGAAAPYEVTVSFAVPQSGRCVVTR